MPTATIEPFDEALKRLSERTPVGSALRTAEWSRVPLALRERALFSAGIEKLNVLQAVHAKLSEALALDGQARGRAFMDKSRFVAEMRGLMQREGLATGTETLTDPGSRTRLELIYEFQTTDAYEFGRWKMGQDADVLDAFPAQEFLRVEARAQPRTTWPQRWAEAGGRTYQGRRIALKSDPVWVQLSRFGRPWPPFDFNSGMGVESISREDAEALGVPARGVGEAQCCGL